VRPVLFRCGGIHIYSYPAMLYLGIVLGVYAQLAAALSIGLSVWRTLGSTLLLLTAALFGARMLFVCQNWHLYRNQPRAIWRCSDGGASLYGGLLLAVPLSVPLLAMVAIPFGVFWDVTSFTLLIGLIVTRVGCFLHGCCAGRPSSSWFALNLPDHTGVWTRRIPVQILEAGWGAVVLTGAVALWRHVPFQGALFFHTVGAYGAARIVLEGLRQQQDRVRGVSLHAAISALFVSVSIVAFGSAWWR
jgi:phosphatidylglycerol:prolipoprotein diacylglycerol transferase